MAFIISQKKKSQHIQHSSLNHYLDTAYIQQFGNYIYIQKGLQLKFQHNWFYNWMHHQCNWSLLQWWQYNYAPILKHFIQFDIEEFKQLMNVSVLVVDHNSRDSVILLHKLSIRQPWCNHFVVKRNECFDLGVLVIANMHFYQWSWTFEG